MDTPTDTRTTETRDATETNDTTETTRSRADRLRVLATSWSRAHRELILQAADFADSGEWALEGFATAAHWLAEAAGVETCTTREWIRVGRALSEFHATAEAFDSGELSYSKARALTRILTPENEFELLELAATTPAGEIRRALANWMTRNYDEAELAEYHQAQRSVRHRVDPDGMIGFSMRLPPTTGAHLIAELARTAACARRKREGHLEWPTLAQQYADAVEDILGRGGGGLQAEIVLHVRGDGCTLDDGTPIAGSVVEGLAPDAFLRAMIHDAEGRPVNVSARRRHPDARQKRLVKERDRVCIDCGRADLLEYDHDPEFARSRRTLVDELHLRCAPCHQARHREMASPSDR